MRRYIKTEEGLRIENIRTYDKLTLEMLEGIPDHECPIHPVPSSPEHAALKAAKMYWCASGMGMLFGGEASGKSLIRCFRASTVLTGKVNGHPIAFRKPVEVLPRSFFGTAVSPVDYEAGDHGAVHTLSQVVVPLEPGDRVYNRQTLELIHKVPKP